MEYGAATGGQHDAMLGPPVQVAYCVTDLEASARQWVQLGAGPFFVLEHIALQSSTIFGKPGHFDHSSAYGQWGHTMIELVVDHTVGPTPMGRLGLHHLAHFVDDLERAASLLTVRGWPEALRATTATGLRFAFHDARLDLGHMIEIYAPTATLRDFYSMVAGAAEGWDGHDPVRRIDR